MQARNNRAQAFQVYVAEPGYMLARAGIPKFAIITQLANQPTPTLTEFARILRKQPSGSRVPIQYFTFDNRNRRSVGILHIDRTW